MLKDSKQSMVLKLSPEDFKCLNIRETFKESIF